MISRNPAPVARLCRRRAKPFPVAEITAYIDGRTAIPAHGIQAALAPNDYHVEIVSEAHLMEEAIKRGRVLREILKQERLSPVSPEFQYAWLIAFNDGLFNAVEPEGIAGRLAYLAARLEESRLTFEDGREDWVQAIRAWRGDSDAKHD